VKALATCGFVYAVCRSGNRAWHDNPNAGIEYAAMSDFSKGVDALRGASGLKRVSICPRVGMGASQGNGEQILMWASPTLIFMPNEDAARSCAA